VRYLSQVHTQLVANDQVLIANDQVLRDIKEMSSPGPSRIRPIFMDFRLDGDRDVEMSLLCG
jgi:hypothetical protein